MPFSIENSEILSISLRSFAISSEFSTFSVDFSRTSGILLAIYRVLLSNLLIHFHNFFLSSPPAVFKRSLALTDNYNAHFGMGYLSYIIDKSALGDL